MCGGEGSSNFLINGVVQNSKNIINEGEGGFKRGGGSDEVKGHTFWKVSDRLIWHVVVPDKYDGDGTFQM